MLMGLNDMFSTTLGMGKNPAVAVENRSPHRKRIAADSTIHKLLPSLHSLISALFALLLLAKPCLFYPFHLLDYEDKWIEHHPQRHIYESSQLARWLISLGMFTKQTFATPTSMFPDLPSLFQGSLLPQHSLCISYSI